MSVIVDSISKFCLDQVRRGRGMFLGGFGCVVSGLMLILLVANISGLFPYVFSRTRHLVVRFVLSSVLWFRILLRSMFYNLKSFVAVLLPVGAPAGLNPFLVLVERVRLVVRPVTLAVRLVANMGAGHIILCLLGSYLRAGFFVYSRPVVLLLIAVNIFYFLFEVGVSMIQAYIFFLLLNLYADEHC